MTTVTTEARAEPVVRTYGNTTASATCMLCETENAGDAFQCRECSAPMAIVHDSMAEDRRPNIISVVGESNVGKTVYLGFLLDMLSQRAGDFEAIPKGAYAIDLQQNVVSHMSNRIFPPKTAMETDQWHWAYYQVRRRIKGSPWVDVLMPDMAGETLAAEVANPTTFSMIYNLLAKSAGVLLLVDAALAANGAARPDFFALKMISYLDSMYRTGDDEPIGIPVAVLLCKSDYCPEAFTHPQRFIKANLNRLWNLCQSRFSNVQFFACSAVGSLGYATSGGDDVVVPVPLHTALQGILEPFEWILDQIR